MEATTFVGLDVHKRMTSVAIAESGRAGEVRFLGEIPSTPEALHRLVERLKGSCPLATSIPHGSSSWAEAPLGTTSRRYQRRASRLNPQSTADTQSYAAPPELTPEWVLISVWWCAVIPPPAR
jgi:hypothetical protein